MSEFHFLRPWWLAAFLLLPLVLWAWHRRLGRGGNWHAVVDRELAPFVLQPLAGGRGWRWAYMLLVGVASTLLLALAGPVWERLPQPVFRDNSALVIALDLSRSMLADDVQPSRLERARFEIVDILQRRKDGQTALIVYSAHAFTVTPLTTDTKTIEAMVSTLSPDLMPTQGSRATAALAKAEALLDQAGLEAGEILLLTDGLGEADEVGAAFEEAARLGARGFRVSVLGVGTAQGGVVRLPGGKLMKDRDGEIVVAQTDAAELGRLAGAGAGRFSMLRSDDRDLDVVLPGTAAPPDAAQSADENLRTDLWREEGPWLVLFALPFAALAFRRGWLACALLCVMLPLPQPGFAADAGSLWLRPDQHGSRALNSGDAARAAQLFVDPEWRAAAQYRAEQFAESAATLEGIDTPRANYNRGNALARAGQLPAAIDAYERSLEAAPDHEDARANLEAIKKLLPEPPPQEQSADEKRDSEAGEKDESQEAEGAQQQGEQGEQQQEGQQSDAQQQESQQRESAGQEAGEADEQQETAGQRADSEEEAARQEDARSRESEPTPDEAEPRQGELARAEAGEELDTEEVRALEQWLRRVPDDPGGLLRRKFEQQYRRAYRNSSEPEEDW